MNSTNNIEKKEKEKEREKRERKREKRERERNLIARLMNSTNNIAACVGQLFQHLY